MRRPLPVAGLLALLACLAPAPEAHAQDVLLPADKQAQLMTGVLGYTPPPPTDEVVVGIVYQERFRPSRSAGLAFAAALRAMGAQAQLWRKPIRVVLIDAEDGDLARRLSGYGVHVAYVAPLRGLGAADVQRAASASGAVTFTAVPEYVAQGVLAGVSMRGNRPEVLLNLATARSDQRTVGAQLLRIARVVVR
jgi:hypothetical protein